MRRVETRCPVNALRPRQLQSIPVTRRIEVVVVPARRRLSDVAINTRKKAGRNRDAFAIPLQLDVAINTRMNTGRNIWAVYCTL